MGTERSMSSSGMKFYKPLGLYYRERRGTIVFSDGVTYSRAESLLISKASLSPLEAKAIHYVKKLFDGELEIPVKRIQPRQLDMLDALGKKFARPDIIGKKEKNADLYRRIDAAVRRRKGVVEAVQTDLFKE